MGLLAFHNLSGRGDGLRVGPEPWEEVTHDAPYQGGLEPAAYTPQFRLVEASTKAAPSFERGAQRGLLEGSGGQEGCKPLPGEAHRLAPSAPSPRSPPPLLPLWVGWPELRVPGVSAPHPPPCFSPGDVLDLNPEAGDRARHWVSSGAHVEMSRAIGWGDVKRADPAPLSWTLGLPGADVDEAVRPRVRLVHEIKEGDGLGHQVTPLCQHCTPAPN